MSRALGWTLALALCAACASQSGGRPKPPPGQCDDDLDCTMPDTCVRGWHGMGRGVCAHVQEIPTRGANTDRRDCNWDSDCPPNWSCRRISASEGICVQE